MTKIYAISLDTSTQLLIQKTFGESGHSIEVAKQPNQLLNSTLAKELFDVLIFDTANFSNSEISSFVPALKQKFSGRPIVLLLETNSTFTATDLLGFGVFQALLKTASLSSDLVKVVGFAASSQSVGEGVLEDYPTLEELEKRYLKIVLEKTHGRKERAAKILGINRRTLYRKEREYGWVSDEVLAESEN